MNPDTQIIINEIAHRFTDNDAKWDRRLAAQDKAISTLVAAQEGFVVVQEGHINALEKTTGLLEDWRQNLEGIIDDLRLEVGRVSKHWERVLMDKPSSMPGILALAPSAGERPPAGSTAASPCGHCFESGNREMKFGSVTTLLSPPDKGTFTSMNPPSFASPPVVHQTSVQFPSTDPILMGG